MRQADKQGQPQDKRDETLLTKHPSPQFIDNINSWEVRGSTTKVIGEQGAGLAEAPKQKRIALSYSEN